jgi:hypothetical protein
MASPFGDMNDTLLGIGKVMEDFRKEYPDDDVLYFSSGYLVKRRKKGDLDSLGFPAYFNHKLGGIVVSSKRIYFHNPRWTPHDVLMKILFGLVLLVLLPMLVVLIVLAILIPIFLLLLAPVFLMMPLLFFALSLAFVQHMKCKVSKEFSNARAVRSNETSAMMIKYHMIDYFDGERTFHFVSYNHYNNEVLDLIRTLDVGKVIA